MPYIDSWHNTEGITMDHDHSRIAFTNFDMARHIANCRAAREGRNYVIVRDSLGCAIKPESHIKFETDDPFEEILERIECHTKAKQ